MTDDPTNRPATPDTRSTLQISALQIEPQRVEEAYRRRSSLIWGLTLGLVGALLLASLSLTALISALQIDLPPAAQLIIGLALVYAILPISVMSLLDVIADVLTLRPKYLLAGIRDLLLDSTLVAKVVAHPAIRLVRGIIITPEQHIPPQQADIVARGGMQTPGDSGVNRLDYIPAQIFVPVLLDILRLQHDNERYLALLETINRMPDGPDKRIMRRSISSIQQGNMNNAALRIVIEDLDDKTYAQTLMSQLDAIEGEMGRGDMGVMAFRAGVQKIELPYLRDTLFNRTQEAPDMAAVRQDIAEWFNAAMWRATHRYANTMKQMAFSVAILLVIILNIDVFQIGAYLWQTPNVFTSASADDTAENTPLPFGWYYQVPTTAPPLHQTVQRVPQNIASEQRAGLSGAWQSVCPCAADVAHDTRNLWTILPGTHDNWLQAFIIKLAGFAISVVLIGRGAPFWFSLTRRLLGIGQERGAA